MKLGNFEAPAWALGTVVALALAAAGAWWLYAGGVVFLKNFFAGAPGALTAEEKIEFLKNLPPLESALSVEEKAEFLETLGGADGNGMSREEKVQFLEQL